MYKFGYDRAIRRSCFSGHKRRVRPFLLVNKTIFNIYDVPFLESHAVCGTPGSEARHTETVALGIFACAHRSTLLGIQTALISPMFQNSLSRPALFLPRALGRKKSHKIRPHVRGAEWGCGKKYNRKTVVHHAGTHILASLRRHHLIFMLNANIRRETLSRSAFEPNNPQSNFCAAKGRREWSILYVRTDGFSRRLCLRRIITRWEHTRTHPLWELFLLTPPLVLLRLFANAAKQ